MKVTILRTLGPVLAKRITVEGVLPYDDAAYFLHDIHEVSDLAQFGALLDSIRKDPRACYIRGIPVAPDVAKAVTFKDGKPALNERGAYRRKSELFQDTPTNLLCIDVDDPDAKHAYDGLPPWQQCVAWIVENLPQEFHRASFFYQLSSSYGIKPGLRAHLWFWLETPINSLAAREWGKAWNEKVGRNVVDTSIFTPVTPHYTADPLVDDPLGLWDLPKDDERTGFCQSPTGKHVVALAPLAPDARPRVSEYDDSFAQLAEKDAIEGITVELARQYLAKIPNGKDGTDSQDYGTWLKVGAALQHQFGEEGRELWHEWSSHSERYDADDLDRRFDSFSESRGQAATFASIIHMAGGRIVDTEATDEKFRQWSERIDSETSPTKLMHVIMQELGDSDVDPLIQQLLIDRCAKRLKKITGSNPSKELVKKALKKADDTERSVLQSHLEFRLQDAILDEYFEGGALLRYVIDTFWEFDRSLGCWIPLYGEAPMRGRIQAFIRKLLDNGDKSANELSRLMGCNEERSSRVSSLTTTLISVVSGAVAVSGLDPLGLRKNITDPVINCNNGTVHLHPETGDLDFRAHDPSLFLTHAISCAYDADATCPTWDSAVEKVFRGVPNAQAQIEVFYEFWGYVLCASRSYGEAFGIMKGPGGNGKSFLIEIFMQMFGIAASSVSLASLAEKQPSAHWEASLVGKLLLVDDDFKAHGKLPDEHLKRYSGHKLMTANPKFGAPYNFMCRAMCMVLTNSWPNTVDLSEGIRRRAFVWEVNYTLSDEDKDPRHRTRILQHELPGVLNHLIRGAQRVIRRGRIKACPEMIEARERWLNSGSTVARFASTMLVPTPFDPDESVLGSDLFTLYKAYVGHFEDIRIQMGRNRFYESLKELGYKVSICSHTKGVQIVGARVNQEFLRQMKDEIGAFSSCDARVF